MLTVASDTSKLRVGTVGAEIYACDAVNTCSGCPDTVVEDIVIRCT